MIPDAFNYVYDPEADVWDRGADMPTARAGAGVAVVDDLLYVIGGDSAWYFGVFDVNEQYTPFGYGTIPPTINVSSPYAGNYSSSAVSLNFTLNRAVDWTGYSLDGKENVTASGNTTLKGLTNGLHNLTVYANDTFGNMGASETISFTVAVPEPFPVVPVAAAIIIAVAVAASLLLYNRKRRKKVNVNN